MTMHECVYCDASFAMLQQLVEHLALSHPDEMKAKWGGIDFCGTMQCWCDRGTGLRMRYTQTEYEAMSTFAKHLQAHGGAIAHFLEVRLGVHDRSNTHDRP